MEANKPLCITYTATGDKHKWKISNDYYAGQPILKIIPLNGALCKHRNIKVCPVFNFHHGDFNNRNNEIRKNRKYEDQRRKNTGIFCVFVIVFSAFFYVRSVLISVKEMNCQKQKFELFLNNLEQKNYNQLCFSDGDDDGEKE